MRPSRFLTLLLLVLLVVMSLAQDSPDEDPNRAFSRANEAAAEAAAAAADGVEAATPPAKADAGGEAAKVADEPSTSKKDAEVGGDGSKTAELEAKIKTLEALLVEKEGLAAKQGALEKDNVSLEKENAEFKAKITQLEKELADKEGEVTRLSDDKRQVEEQSKSKEGELQDTKNQLNDKTNQLNDRNNQLDKATKELQDARTKITALMIVQEDLMKQKDDLHLTYSELREKYENPALQHYVTKRAEIFYKNNIGLQGAVNKTSELLIPKIEAGSMQYAILLNSTHNAIKTSISPILGEHSHWISGFISYGLFFIPLFCSVYTLVSVRAILKLRGLIMFCHMYFCLCAVVAAGFTLYLHSDPLRLLQASNAGTYIWTQLMLGLLYLVYFVLQCLALCQSKALDVWISRVVQLLAVTVIGGLYYATVFTPAMLDRPPALISQRGLLIFYGIPAFVFGIMLFIERAQHEDPNASGYGKKSSAVEYGTDDEMKILLTTTDPSIKKPAFSVSGIQLGGARDEEAGKYA